MHGCSVQILGCLLFQYVHVTCSTLQFKGLEKEVPSPLVDMQYAMLHHSLFPALGADKRAGILVRRTTGTVKGLHPRCVPSCKSWRPKRQQAPAASFLLW